MPVRPLFVVLAVMIVAGSASAQIAGPQVTLDGFVGGWFPDQATRPSVDNSFAGGGRIGIQMRPWFRAEATYTAAASHDVHMGHTGIDAVFDLLPDRRLVPYVEGGWTQIAFNPHPGETQTLNGWEVGVGLYARLQSWLFARVDARDAIVELDQPQSWLHNWIVTAGLHARFGGAVRDTDGDGVGDRDDECPDTPAGAVVDARGCPLDADGDRVPDGIDRCPGTPAGARVDAAGCPLDTDGDGVPDGIDQCAGTPAGAHVDTHGCPLDADGDGVPDGIDQCPGTPAGARVDAEGCPSDTDGDGIPDGIDQCPDTPADTPVDDRGCALPSSEREVELVERGVLRLPEVRFENNKATLTADSHAVLDDVGAILERHPDLAIEIGGHTDSYGEASYNQQLSERRAQAVLTYLTGHFPDLDAGRFTVKGYGESQPVASDRTRDGRAANRRVEFKVVEGSGPR
jgi:outer membrane protein OmpA-like peptidoglycan-associated protein